MRSDSVASFLELARENQLLKPDQFDDLFQQPDVPQSNLSALCDFLQSRKVLTAFQADMIRSGRGYELSFAGYPVNDDLGPCPGGNAYRVAHPSLRTPLVLRRLRADWLAPADNVSAFIQGAQAVSPIVHPNLGHLLDAGVHRDEPFVVLDPTDGADMQTLIADIGPMPVALGIEYLRQAARGVAAAHSRNIPHGDLRPKHLIAGPLVQSSKPRSNGTTRLRPSATATIRVSELGLIPRRPAGMDFPGADPAYLPPERSEDGTATMAGDVYMLAGCLRYLLTAQAPNTSPLATVRSDVPPALATLVEEMTAIEPRDRPTVGAVLSRLDSISAPTSGTIPAQPRTPETSSILADSPKAKVDSEPEIARVESDVVLIDIEPVNPDQATLSSGVDVIPAPILGGWDAYTPPVQEGLVADASPPEWSPPAFVPSEFGESRSAPGYDPTEDGVSVRRTPRPLPPGSKKKLWIWLGLGIALQILAVILWAILFATGGEEPDSGPKAKPIRQAPKR